jgi:AraC family transcriptional regulator
MVTRPAQLRYDAAIVVPAGFAADGEVNLTDIPGGRHAVAPFEGSAQHIAGTWQELYGRWLPESGFQPVEVGFELYRGEAWEVGIDHFRCDICVPVKPL